jgi:peroxiredoxin
MPAVQRAYDTFKGQNIKVLAISIDSGGAKSVAAFMQKNNYNMPALLDSRMQTMNKLGVSGIPVTFIVDRQGKVVAKANGQVDFDSPEFRDYVQRLAK